MKSPKTYLIVFLSLTTIGGSILAWQQYGELVELRAVAMNKDERADLQKRAWDLERANKQLRDQVAAQRPVGNADGLITADETVRDRRDPNGKGGGRGGPPSGINSMQQLEAVRELMAKPEVQALMSSQQKAAVEARYAALFKSLNLAPEQAEKLKTILADRQTTMQDVMSAAREQGIDPRTDRNAVQKLMEVARNDINSSIKSVIGESGFNQLENYEKTMPQRNVVNQLQQRLSYTDTPLTSIQADQLVQILASNTPAPTPPRPAATAGSTPPPPGDRGGRFSFDVGGSSQNFPAGRMPDLGALGAVIGGVFGGGSGPGGPVGGMLTLGGGDSARGGGNATAPITPTAINQSQAVLAAPQVAALQQLQQQQQNQQQLAKIVAETMSAQNANATKSGGTPPPTKEKRPGS